MPEYFVSTQDGGIRDIVPQLLQAPTAAMGSTFMDFGELIWQALAVLALGGLVVILILAIIEPGPLEKQKGFGAGRRKLQSDEDADETDASESGLAP